MSEMSDMHKLIMAMKLAKTAQVGMELTYFDVIELLGELDSLKTCIAELETKIRHNALWQASEDAEERAHLEKLVPDLKRRIAELEAERRWRIIADGEMPDDRATVLVAFKNREILTATYYKHYEGFGGVENYWHIEGWHSGEVTHWMPLPQPPEEQ